MKFCKKINLFVLLVCILVLPAGCFMVDGPKKFHFDAFREFFELETVEERDEYLESGQLDTFKSNDVLIIPFIKECNHEECIFLLTAYSKEEQKEVLIQKATLATTDGDVIFQTDEPKELSVLLQWESQMTPIHTFEKEDEWFYHGNNLVLTIQAVITTDGVSNSVECSYPLTIIGYKGPSWQV